MWEEQTLSLGPNRSSKSFSPWATIGDCYSLNYLLRLWLFWAFFYQLPCFGKVVNPEVTHLINEFILGLICNVIASVREGAGPPWKNYAMGHLSLELRLPVLAPSRSILFASFLPDLSSSTQLHHCVVLCSCGPETEPSNQGVPKLCTERNNPALKKSWKEMSEQGRLRGLGKEFGCVIRLTIKTKRTRTRCPEHTAQQTDSIHTKCPWDLIPGWSLRHPWLCCH